MIDSQIQREILSNCSFFSNGSRYSNLKPKDDEIENDRFNYHLQHLVKKGYLIKRNSRYF